MPRRFLITKSVYILCSAILLLMSIGEISVGCLCISARNTWEYGSAYGAIMLFYGAVTLVPGIFVASVTRGLLKRKLWAYYAAICISASVVMVGLGCLIAFDIAYNMCVVVTVVIFAWGLSLYGLFAPGVKQAFKDNVAET